MIEILFLHYVLFQKSKRKNTNFNANNMFTVKSNFIKTLF